MKKIILLAFLFLMVNGCKEKKTDGKFNPPRDGLIRKEMADRYIKISVEFDKILKLQSERMNEFKKKYKLSENLEELYKAEFRQKNPDIVKEWEEINSTWSNAEDSIYKMCGSSEEEFTWIASALINPKNKPMQEYIQRRISELTQQQEVRKEEGK